MFFIEGLKQAKAGPDLSAGAEEEPEAGTTKLMEDSSKGKKTQTQPSPLPVVVGPRLGFDMPSSRRPLREKPRDGATSSDEQSDGGGLVKYNEE